MTIETHSAYAGTNTPTDTYRDTQQPLVLSRWTCVHFFSGVYKKRRMFKFTAFVNALVALLRCASDDNIERFLRATRDGGVLAQKLAQLMVQNGLILLGTKEAEVKRRVLAAVVCNSIGQHDFAWTKQCIQEFSRRHPNIDLRYTQEQPVASGTCAQVHLAGNYAVKVIHPGIAEELNDWERCLPAVTLALRLGGYASLGQLLTFMIMSIRQQLDLTIEYQCAVDTYEAAWFKRLAPHITTPAPIAATEHVYVMTLELYPTISELYSSGHARLEYIECRAALACLAYIHAACSSGQAGQPGQAGQAVLNVDLHAGNVAARGAEQFIIYDYGASLRVDASTAPLLLEAMQSHDIVSTCARLYGEEARGDIAAIHERVLKESAWTKYADVTLLVIRAVLASKLRMPGADAFQAYRCVLNFLMLLRALSFFEGDVRLWATVDAARCQRVHCSALVATALRVVGAEAPTKAPSEAPAEELAGHRASRRALQVVLEGARDLRLKHAEDQRCGLLDIYVDVLAGMLTAGPAGPENTSTGTPTDTPTGIPTDRPMCMPLAPGEALLASEAP
jgi:hypothetical protein